jgi:3',5'-cyclic AMP phosphodiesterase CpdA
MRFTVDPAISTKILKMSQRVRWQDPLLQKRDIDQTRLVLEDGKADSPEFSFLVIGDSGSGYHRGHNPQRKIAEAMLPHLGDCRFVMHTGDVVYLVGSSEYYPKNFIEPYRELLVGGEDPSQISFDRMVFNLPFFPVPGNHDYYDLPILYGFLAQATLPVRRLLCSRLALDVGWHGSGQGSAYAKAFLDYLKAIEASPDLDNHLQQHYSARTETGYCLQYRPGQFTRLPNRYYTFRAGDIDFFALDSNTFNGLIPLPSTPAGDTYRRQLEQERGDLERQILEIYLKSANLNPNQPDQAEQLDDLRARLEQLEEVQRDVDKQLDSKDLPTIDQEQLEWLERRLVESWHNKSVRGRVIFFHHPPYVTEASKWHQAQTLAIRHNLRQVLNRVAETVGDGLQGRSVVDLVLNGHAHCLEHLQTLDTGHADSYTDWIVCGGSGFSLRRQRAEGPILTEAVGDSETPIAKSLLFVGRDGHSSQKHRPYSFLRIDVKAGTPPQFVVRPFICDRFQQQWQESAMEPFTIGSQTVRG